MGDSEDRDLSDPGRAEESEVGGGDEADPTHEGEKPAGSRRSPRRRNLIRFALLVVFLASAAVIIAGAATTDISTASKDVAPEAPPADNITVIAESGRAGTLIAYDTDGSILYYNNSRTKYFGVDPVENESMTVEYVATDTIHHQCSDPPCARNVIERANLSTGETEVILERYHYKERAGEWHDHVRINETHVLIGDILYDQVYIVNLETEMIEWVWDAQRDFDVFDSGGPWPRDWTHLNDVSYLDDGRVMTSLRNHDQVVFIDPETGVDHDWTLGSDGDHDTLYEQHNPDFIPEEYGGPAVVVADSENNRVKEFQREDGEWHQTWEWSDEQMQWPRDADRLPNGNTLVVDSHGNRVMEINPDGDIVWEVPSTMPYDAERLGTGPESEGGYSAQELNLTSQTYDGVQDAVGFNPFRTVGNILNEILPHRVSNAIFFVAPVWFGRPQFGAAFLILLAILLWIVFEARWRFRDAGFRFRLPVYRGDSDE